MRSALLANVVRRVEQLCRALIAHAERGVQPPAELGNRVQVVMPDRILVPVKMVIIEGKAHLQRAAKVVTAVRVEHE